MCGRKRLPNLNHCYDNIVDDCNIYGSQGYVGGIMGYSDCYEDSPIVKNTNIIGTSINCDQVGGIAGGTRYLLYY